MANAAITPTTTAIDPTIKALASAILQKESGGNYKAKGGSGEYGAYQFMPATWKSWAGNHLSDPNAPMTVENQNKVAYAQIKMLKDKGLNPAQIASQWNSGKPNAYKENHRGVNKFGIAYDTPKYVADVSAIYKQKVAAIPKTPAPAPIAPINQADLAFAEQTGALFPANTDNPSAIGEALKSVGNVPKSAFNFVKGALNLINPKTIVDNLKEAGAGLKELAGQSGGYLNAFGKAVKELPGAAYETLVPEAGKGLITAGKGAFTGNQANIDIGLKTAQRSLVNDPVGSIAPFLLAAEGGAKLADSVANKKALKAYVEAGGEASAFKPAATYSQGLNKGIEKTAQPVKYVFGGASEMAGNAAKFATGQATGLQPETIGQILEEPKAFSKVNRSVIDRGAVGSEIKSALAERSKAMRESGYGYKPIRESGVEVKVDPNFIERSIEELSGMIIKKGKLETSGAAKLRDASDVRALQHLYDLWKPEFKNGKLTADKFLNFREDLSGLSKFERQIGKSEPLENVAKQIRRKLNDTYRGDIPGLGDVKSKTGEVIQRGLDTEFAERRAELRRLSRDLVDRRGELKPNAFDIIANATGKTFRKGELLNRLEEIKPGITSKIKNLKAIEDIQHASGVKVGVYTRTGLQIGAFMSGVLPGIITAILTSPEIAVPLLRRYGLLKNSAAIQAVLNALKTGGAGINNLPASSAKLLQKDLKELKLAAENKKISQPELPTSGAFSMRFPQEEVIINNKNMTNKKPVSFSKFLEKKNFPKQEKFSDFLLKEKRSNLGRKISGK
jgi:hypothetical protein